MPDLLIFNRCTVDHADEAYARDNYKNDHIDITKWDQEEKNLKKTERNGCFFIQIGCWKGDVKIHFIKQF